MEKILFLALCFFNIFDVFVTNHILTHGGIELNILMKYIYLKFGIFGILFLKIIFLTFIGYGVYKKINIQKILSFATAAYAVLFFYQIFLLVI